MSFSIRDSVWLCLSDGDFPNHLDVARPDICYEQNTVLDTWRFVDLFCIAHFFGPIPTGKPVGIRQWSLSYLSRSQDNWKIYHKWPSAIVTQFYFLF